jgi:predicted permease
MRTLLSRLLSIVRRRPLDRDLDEEIAAHLAHQEAEFQASGMAPEAARAAALRQFGGIAQTKEDYRDRRGVPWLETVWRGIRYALRGLARNPGFAAAATLSLALGIGANTAIFSLFYPLMLRMLPVERPQELVSMYRTGGWSRGFVSYPLYQEIAKRSDLFQGVVARTGVAKAHFTPRPGDRGEFAQQEFVSGNYFSVLGVGAALGRIFTGEDNTTPGAHPVAVISYDLWRNRYGADPAILGTKILLANKPYIIIGVAAAGFHGVEFERRAQVWTPAMMADVKVASPNYWWIWVVARRRPEISPRQVQAAIDVLMQQHLNALYPPTYNAAMRKRALGQRLEVRDAGIGLSLLREEFSRPLTILLIAVGLVLLAACANVANLMLARGAARRKEIALRLSLGATRARLVTQSLTESVVLMLAGTSLGVLLAGWGQRFVLQFLPEQTGNPFASAPDGPVLAYTICISAIAVLLFGLGPALRFTTVDPATGLRPGTSGSGRPGMRRALVVAQVAFSVVLVAMAALFGHNLYALRGVDLGFRNQNVVALSLDVPREMQKDVRNTARQLAAQLQQLPGIFSVSYGFPGPFQMGTSSGSIRVPGSERTEREPADVDITHIAPRYFETIGARLAAGRDFESADRDDGRKVAVVNEAFVREFFPGEKNPLTRRLSFDDSKPEGGEPVFIEGVVRDIRHSGVQERARPTVYLPIDQYSNSGAPILLLRTQAEPAALLRPIYGEMRRISRGLLIADMHTLRSRIDDSIFEQRLLAAIGAFFGILALMLAAVGLYGVVSYGTARRLQEIGIRIALGARRGQVVWMILRDSLVLVGVGLAIGLPAAFVSARAVQALLFDIPPGDPPALLLTALTLTAAGVAAAYVPARRAASVDPTKVLRSE